jgi:hypothetical protein
MPALPYDQLPSSPFLMDFYALSIHPYQHRKKFSKNVSPPMFCIRPYGHPYYSSCCETFICRATMRISITHLEVRILFFFLFFSCSLMFVAIVVVVQMSKRKFLAEATWLTGHHAETAAHVSNAFGRRERKQESGPERWKRRSTRWNHFLRHQNCCCCCCNRRRK